MNEAELARLRHDVNCLKRQWSAQRLLLLTALACIAAMATALLARPHSVAAQSTQEKDGVLRVRGLVVEDQNGHERSDWVRPCLIQLFMAFDGSVRGRFLDC